MTAVRRVSIALAVSIVATTVSPAAAALCQKRSGALVVRDACKKREIPVPLEEVAPAVAGAPGALGDAGRPVARVLDASGRELGRVLRFGAEVIDVQLERAALGAPVVVTVRPQGMLGSVYWNAAGCTGTPLIGESPDVARRAEVLGTTLYLPAASAGEQTLPSLELGGTSCDTANPELVLTVRGTCCYTPSAPMGPFPVTVVTEHALSSIGIALPLRVEVAP